MSINPSLFRGHTNSASLIPDQVAQIQNSQLAERDQDPQGTQVFCLIRRKVFRILAFWVVLTRPGQRSTNHGAVRTYHCGFHALNR